MEFLLPAKLALYGIFLNYYCYYVFRGSFIPHGTVIFFGTACLFVLMNALNRGIQHISYEMKCWAAYGILAAATFMLAQYPNDVLGDVAKYMQRLIIIALVAYICEREGSVRFGIRLLAVTAVGCSIAVLMTVDDIQQKLSISTGADLSANDVGALMAFGCFAVLFAFGINRYNAIFGMIIKVAAIIAMISVIFLAGSRKSIYAVIILFVSLLFLCGRDVMRRSSFIYLCFLIIILFVAYRFVNTYLLPNMESTNLYVRLFGRGAEAAETSNEGRIELYIQALRDFVSHPITGLGFNNFAEVHGLYSHSTYVETLACNGIIGILYIIPYFSMLRKQIYLIRYNRDWRERLFQKEMLAFYISFAFVGIGIPYLYKDIPCIILGIFVASQTISFNRLNYERREECSRNRSEY